MTKDARRCLCGGSDFSLVFTYNTPPSGEVAFGFSSGQPYHREIVRCAHCGHLLSTYEVDSQALYAGDYVNANYSQDGIDGSFERIIALDPSQSDNAGRVERVSAFASEHFSEPNRERKLLDVGSGLGVFVYGMKAQGWDLTALDPDPRAVEHARTVIGAKAIMADFMHVSDIGVFDVITFNKVLEHVLDPIPMLAKAKTHLQPGGFIYIEVPDGERAGEDGPGREEFFIDHLHIFSPASLAILIQRAGFWLVRLERLKEPSGKYTLWAFLALS